MIIVDASVIVTALGDDGPDGARARQRIVTDDLAAPHLLDIEVLSAWRRLAASGHMSGQRADQAIEDLAQLRLERSLHRPLLSRCWELRENLTAYDAAYVSLAELTGCLLLTADARLAAAPGPRCEIEVLRTAI